MIPLRRPLDRQAGQSRSRTSKDSRSHARHDHKMENQVITRHAVPATLRKVRHGYRYLAVDTANFHVVPN